MLYTTGKVTLSSFSENGRKRIAISQILLLLIAVWIIAAEAVTTFNSPTRGLWMHASLLSVLIGLTLFEKSRPVSRTWLCLAFAPLIRVISLSMPLSSFRLIYWYLLTGLPIFLAAFATIRYFRLPRERFGLRANWSFGQWFVGLTGLGLGYVEYLILQPQPLISETTLLAVLEVLLILVIFTGLAEEVIFRGLMQHAVERVFGGVGVVYVAGIFAVLHLGYRSLADLVFVFLVALYFGYYVRRTRSILGVTLAHGLTNVSLFLIFPFLVGHATVGGGDVGPSLISPPRATPTATPTPFLPYTPTPFMPVDPTPLESRTPTPDATSAIETDVPAQTPSATDEPSAYLPGSPDIEGTNGRRHASNRSSAERNSSLVDWRFWRLCAKLIHSWSVDSPNVVCNLGMSAPTNI